LGPEDSATLQAMIDESSSDTNGNYICPDSARPDFYVNGSTVDETTLIPYYISRGPPCLEMETCLHDFFAQKGTKLYRAIATDQALARMIRTRLRLRGVDDRAGNIVLIYEEDTLYGRALVQSLGRCLGELLEEFPQITPDPFANKPFLHRFKYHSR